MSGRRASKTGFQRKMNNNKGSNMCFDVSKNPQFSPQPPYEPIVKKLLNTTDHAADECLAGMVLVNNGLIMMDGHRVILRRDYLSLADKVKILSGGSAGHEPGHAGFIGPGMLTGIACGDIFSPPPAGSVLAAIRALAQDDTAGILVIVKNYTGDRLSFGLAVERAKSIGINVKMVLVSEDSAGSTNDRSNGRRGLAGTVLIHKIAGAMAEEGKTLDEIHSMCELAVANMATVSITVEYCTVPKGVKGAPIALGDAEMEIGHGIHGEPGSSRIPFTNTSSTVYTMLEGVFHSESQTGLNVHNGDEIILLINNLGGSSKIEEMVFAKDTILQLRKKGRIVVRTYCGTLLTALNMAGFSITVMKHVPEILRFLDAPTCAPSWPRHFRMMSASGKGMPSKVPPPPALDDRNFIVDCPRISEDASKILFLSIQYSATSVAACEDQLNVFDLETGDGMFGSRMKRAAEAILRVIDEGLDTSSPFSVFQKLSLIAEDKIGGTSGALYSIFLMAASQVFVHLTEVTIKTWLTALKAGVAAVMKFGGAEPGDRTMVDPLSAVADAFESAYTRRPKKPLEALEYATDSAEIMAQRTLAMRPRAGRASYVSGSRKLQSPDPGAHAVGIWMRAVCEAIKYKMGSDKS